MAIIILNQVRWNIWDFIIYWTSDFLLIGCHFRFFFTMISIQVFDLNARQFSSFLICRKRNGFIKSNLSNVVCLYRDDVVLVFRMMSLSSVKKKKLSLRTESTACQWNFNQLIRHNKMLMWWNGIFNTSSKQRT